MCDLLRDAMSSGAAGFATSCIRTHRGVDGKPVPSRFAELAELDALADAMARRRPRRDHRGGRRAVGQRVPLRAAAADRRAHHHHRAARLELGWAQAHGRAQRPRVGERRRGVAAGDATAVALPVLDGFTVHPQPAGVVRRADGRRPRGPARGVRITRVAGADERGVPHRPLQLRRHVGRLRDRPLDRTSRS